MTIGTYEAPIWAKKGWLVPLDKLDADYDVDDLLPAIRAGLSYDGKLYAAPFYGESSMVDVPHGPDGEGRASRCPTRRPGTSSSDAADKMTDKANGIYGICLRGKAGWGENMAFLTAMSNSFGARWFDEKWKPQFDTPEWKDDARPSIVDLMKADGPPGASSNGFNENLALFHAGKCGMWIDATVAASLRHRSEGSRRSPTRSASRWRPTTASASARNWLWAWSLGDSRRLEEGRRGREVHLLGDLEGLHRARRHAGRLGATCRPARAPRSTRIRST